jgi:NTP pyrophosphatase (non-canonical NTP hydrolase)
VWHLNEEKGWHSTGATVVEKMMLAVGELSEGVECIRNGEPHIWQLGATSAEKVMPVSVKWQSDKKPEGVLSEIADCVIRLMDLCEDQDWDLEDAIKRKHEFNKTRMYRHGGKVL